jgi:prepilin-type N-terminal cleavage/methylation domain-containing protein
MKTHHPRTRGFTLVELLVVIAIIAVLAGVGFSVGIAAKGRANKAKALATITAIESGVDNFYTEYGGMPKDITSDEKIDTEGTGFLNVMLGLEGSGTDVLNTRSIKFLSLQEGRVKKKGGLIYDSMGTTVLGLYDPWGEPFEVMLDGDNDQSVTPAPAGGGGRKLNGRRSAVWSNGPDGINGGGGPTDDVKSWQ